MARRKFGLDRHLPAGEWVRATMLEEVVGVAHRRRSAHAFAAAVARAESAGLPYGLRLELEPSNPHDANAIKVLGFAVRRRLFFGASEKEWHVGYIARDLAADLHRDLVAKGVQIAAELYSVYVDGDFVDVKLLVLAPPGHSYSSRTRGRDSGADDARGSL